MTGLAGGYNETRRAVDMRWQRYDERDLQGYRVTRESDGKQICPASGTVQDGLSCTDPDPPAAGSKYRVEAFDCQDLKAPVCTLRAGAGAFTPTITPVTGSTPPAAPTGLTASVVDGKPTLSWTAPACVHEWTGSLLPDLPRQPYS